MVKRVGFFVLPFFKWFDVYSQWPKTNIHSQHHASALIEDATDVLLPTASITTDN